MGSASVQLTIRLPKRVKITAGHGISTCLLAPRLHFEHSRLHAYVRVQCCEVGSSLHGGIWVQIIYNPDKSEAGPNKKHVQTPVILARELARTSTCTGSGLTNRPSGLERCKRKAATQRDSGCVGVRFPWLPRCYLPSSLCPRNSA